VIIVADDVKLYLKAQIEAQLKPVWDQLKVLENRIKALENK
jgi:hypothetical protein